MLDPLAAALDPPLSPPDGAPAALTWPPADDVRLEGPDVRRPLVRLERLEPRRDAAGLLAVLEDDEVWQHLPERPRDAAHYADLLTRRVAEGRVVWLVRLARPYRGLPAGAVAGTSSYIGVSVVDARLEIGATAYRRTLWGSAVNPATKLLLLGFAFDSLGAQRVQLVTDARNERSRRAIARLGAREEGVLRRHQRRADGSLRDTVVFSLIAPEWPAARDALAARLRAAPDLT